MGRLTAMPGRLGAMEPKVKAAPKRADPFYLSREWRALLADVIAARGRFCERCGAGGRIIGDHIVELKDGGAALDPANVELLCARRCHPAKTARARAARAAGAAR
jgi:5-methylcytosine-specific restriction enzyme A